MVLDAFNYMHAIMKKISLLNLGIEGMDYRAHLFAYCECSVYLYLCLCRNDKQ